MSQDQIDYQRVPLERLRSIAAAGGDARSRAAAQREIDARATAADSSATAQQTAVRITTAEHGTPQPEIFVTMPREASVRRLCARLHQLAAEVELALAATSELWAVSLAQVDPCTGIVYLELLYGTEAEVERAVALLSSVVGTSSAERPAARKRDLKAERERRKAKRAAQAAAAVASEPSEVREIAEPPPAAATAPPVSAPPSDLRCARHAFLRAARSEHAAFEAEQLQRERIELPPCATAVLDGAGKTVEYWNWLRAEYEAASARERR